ncbi:TrmH family RNA methyltransferase [Candidatus Leptofilum sp.]|uniref:TrmH family RNA methyltransferase n=1 Tax=Candidatus Leptofilum sp. TaxID=3241576 RepID=UPI003B58C4D7
MQPYEIRQCVAVDCHFRFPAAAGDTAGTSCPHCGAPTKQAATPQAGGTPPIQTSPRFTRLELLLDNIRSLYNVGAIIRTADGAGIVHLHLGGITALPTHPKLAKTALGAETALPWTQHRNSVHAITQLKSEGYFVWVLEEGETAVNLFTTPLPQQPNQPILLLIGNEKVGVDPAIQQLADCIFALPMSGIKNSLNVAVAFGIAIYQIQFGSK